MINIRSGVFETNSSSTHSVAICMKDDYDAWVKGKLFFNDSYLKEFRDAGTFIDKETAIKLLVDSGYREDYLKSLDNDEFTKIIEEKGIYTHIGYLEYNQYLEWFDVAYTTPAGEEVVAFGMYGYDG